VEKNDKTSNESGAELTETDTNEKVDNIKRENGQISVKE